MRLEEKNETSDIDSNSVNFENETTQNEPQFQSGQANGKKLYVSRIILKTKINIPNILRRMEIISRPTRNHELLQLFK